MLFAKDGKGFTEEELIDTNITIYFSIFDRCRTSKNIAYSNKTETVQENKFLGSFNVSLVSVLQNSPKMEGLIKVNRPLDL